MAIEICNHQDCKVVYETCEEGCPVCAIIADFAARVAEILEGQEALEQKAGEDT